MSIEYKRDSLRIVYYHLVSEQRPEHYFDDKVINPQTFRRHLSFFKKRFNIVSLSEAIEMAGAGASLSRTMVITVDDGFAECYNVIAPILHEQKMSATFFLIGNCIDNKDLMWRNKLVVVKKRAGRKLFNIMNDAALTYSLPQPQMDNIMDWSMRAWPMNRKDEIASYLWDAAGIGSLDEYLAVNKPYLTTEQIDSLLGNQFEIGSHSMSHPVFSKLSYPEFENEILESVRLLESRFLKKIISFSYPFGVQATPEFETQMVKDAQSAIKTFLGIKNRLNNYQDCSRWERDNTQFPMSKMIFRLNVLPLLRRLSHY